MARMKKTNAQLDREIAAALSTPAEFVAGFDYVLKDWKAGMPWEQSVDLATTPANKRSHAFTSGARAAAEALGGWIGEVWRIGKHFGLTREQATELEEKARRA
jgi:hypothetical protein